MITPKKNATQSLLLISSSVYVNAQFTILTNTREREKQYIESLVFFIEKSDFECIVVCDNSGYNYPAYINALALTNNKKLELLYFKGSEKLISTHGKGYGEGEIIEYAVENSKLIKSVPGFFKITGRLKLTNINKILHFINYKRNYFMPISLRPPFLRPSANKYATDTRFYYTTKSLFSEYLQNTYTKVNDNDAFYLEHAFFDALKSTSTKRYWFYPVPIIEGVSGSTGEVYRPTVPFKMALLNIFSFFYSIY